MMFRGVNHVAFATGDMDKTVRYWRDLLGMRLVAAHGHAGRRQYFFQVSAYDLIAFFEWDGVEKVRPKRHGEPVNGPFVFDHIAIGMDDDDSLWKMAEKLIAAGFSCSNMVDHGLIHSIYTFDPNGIPVEFCCYVPGIDVMEYPVLADTEKGPAAREGQEPNPNYWPPVTDTFKEDEKVIVPGEGSETFRHK